MDPATSGVVSACITLALVINRISSRVSESRHDPDSVELVMKISLGPLPFDSTFAFGIRPPNKAFLVVLRSICCIMLNADGLVHFFSAVAMTWSVAMTIVGDTLWKAAAYSAPGPPTELNAMDALENRAARVTVNGKMEVRESRDRTRSAWSSLCRRGSAEI